MIKTQFNFEIASQNLTFSASKIDNSASTDPSIPPTRSPDFYFEGVKADGSLQQISLYYDVTDGYRKKALVNGITSDLDTAGADDAITNVSLEGAINPLTFLLTPKDGAPAYIYDPNTVSMVGIKKSSGTAGETTSIIADSASFDAVYQSLTGRPEAVEMDILFRTPNPLDGANNPVKAFTINCNPIDGYLVYTFVRNDSSTFTLILEDADTPIIEQGITLNKTLTIVDNGVTLIYHCSENITLKLTQLSGYISGEAGVYTVNPDGAEPAAIGGAYNPAFDGFRVIFIASLNELTIGGETITGFPSDSGIVITADMSRMAAIAKHFNKLKRTSHKATARFVNPLKNVLKSRK